MSEEEKKRIQDIMMISPTPNGAAMQPKPGPNYICHRCGEHGHFIKYCPTNGNPTFDAASRRTRRPSGIPTNFLTIFHNPASTPSEEKRELWELNSGQHAERIDDHEHFRKEISRTVRKCPSELLCSLCVNPPTSAVLTRCCNLLFCLSCISHALVFPDYKCPKCGTVRQFEHELIADYKTRDIISSFQNGKINIK